MGGSGAGGEKVSGKEDKVEQVLHPGKELVVELAMKVGEDPNRVEAVKVVVTGEDLQPEEPIKLVRAVREVVRGNSRGTSGPGEPQLCRDFLKFFTYFKYRLSSAKPQPKTWESGELSI